MKRLVLFTGLGTALSLLILVGLGWSRNQPGQQPEAKKGLPTEVITYSPSVPKNAERISGSCWTSSNASSLPNAFRCSIDGNGVLDPCFKLNERELLCLSSPAYVGHGIMLDLTEPLPEPEGRADRDLYWALEFESGKECRLISGTASSVNGDICYYYCDSERELVCGSKLDKTEPLWKGKIVRLGDDYDRVLSSEVKNIVRVWK